MRIDIASRKRRLTVIAVSLRKHEHALVENDGQGAGGRVPFPDVSRGRGVPEEMEDERVHTLPRCQVGSGSGSYRWIKDTDIAYATHIASRGEP